METQIPQLFLNNDGTHLVSPAAWPQRRAQLIDALAQGEYGYTPSFPGSCKGGTILQTITKVACGHAVTQQIDLNVPTPTGDYHFPIWLTLPCTAQPVPIFLLLNFRPELYDMYYPLEEIIDSGFGVAVLYYQDISSDDGDFSTGIAGCFDALHRGPTDWGKIGMWAWGASRVMDYLLTRPEIDSKKIVLIGHSRLGKTALWASAQDERFAFACSNGSGCAGAALENEKHPGGEKYADILHNFPYWFCENFHTYAHTAAPFDQHFLLAAQAPRPVAVGSASLDLWADPPSEQASCILADEVYRFLGKTGYCGKRTPASVGESFTDGDIHYHLRHGIHFLGRADWQAYMEFAKKQFKMK